MTHTKNGATIAIAISLMAGAIASCGTQNTTRTADAATAATPSSAEVGMNELSPRERQEGWRLLFDGSTTSGWRGYGRSDMPEGWQAIDGMLVRVAGGGDIITTEQFEDFELALDWRVGPAGNSGVLFRVVESGEPIYYSGPEMQILDDAGHADGRQPLTSAGSNYALHPAPRGVVRPAGEWNSARLLVDGSRVEHWLNGQKIVEYEIGSEDWTQRVAASKFSAWPSYGKATRGHIGLQDHGDRVEFRNVRLRVLP